MEPVSTPRKPPAKAKADPSELDQDLAKKQHGKGKRGSLENPEVYENVPGHVIPILEREFDDFDTEAASFLRGEQAEEQFIGFRLKQGVYGQRQPDVQMVRVKLPFGGVTPEQMEMFGEVVERYAPLGKGHITTRQNIQIHHIPLAEMTEVIRKISESGLSVARGLRQHDAQRHRRPLGRRQRGRALRRHPLRRRLRALLRPPPGYAVDAAQGEDRLHRYPRGPRHHRDPRHGLHPQGQADRRQGGPWRRGPRRRRHLDHAARRPHAVRVRRARQRRLPEGDRGGDAHLRPPELAARQSHAGADQGAGRQDRHRRLPGDGRGGAEGRLGRRARLLDRPHALRRRRAGQRAGRAVQPVLAQRRPLRVRSLR